MSDASNATATRRQRRPQQYIIESILPASQVHLLAGPSGAGKTTLAMQMIEAVAKGDDFLGHRCQQVPQAYISCDRNLESVHATLDRMQFDMDALGVPMFSMLDSEVERKIEKIIPYIRQVAPDTRLLHIDGFLSLCPKGNIIDYGTVAGFLMYTLRLCKGSVPLTIIGSCHDAKLKQGHEYLMERERIIGSTAWGGFSDSIIHIAPTDPKNPEDSTRTITVMPRNAPNEHLKFAMVAGRLSPLETEGVAVELFLLEQALFRLATEKPIFRTADIIALECVRSLSRATVYRYITRLVDAGKLETVTAGGREKGLYKLPTRQ